MWIYNIPVWLLAVLIVTVFLVVALTGLFLARRLLHPTIELNADVNTPVTAFASGLYVFYGLLIGLVAVAAWQDYQDVQKQVAWETATVNALHRDVSLLPEPLRADLHRILVDYLEYVVEVEWPAQRQGELVLGGTILLDSFQERLASFAPADDVQLALFVRTLEEFDSMVENRRLRVDAVDQGLPTPLWVVVLIGAALCILITYYFHVKDWCVHASMVILLTVFIALTIFVTAAMDHPLQGEFSVPADDFRLILQRITDPSLKH